MYKKVLFVASLFMHIKSFHIGYLEWFKKNGYIVYVAANGNNTDLPFVDKCINIPIQRNPFKIDNYRAYKKLKEIILKENFDLIHCHTPTASVLTRLVKRNTNTKSAVVYTAHGFHFFKGAPIKNWILFYPIEKYLSKYTDALITINKEDYNYAKKFKCKSYLVDGIGLQEDRFISKSNISRQDLMINNDDFVIIYVAELSNRKNQYMLLRAMKHIKDRTRKIKLMLVGSGVNEAVYKEYIQKNNLDDYVRMLGYRDDVFDLLNISDMAVSTSKQEGLPVNIIEAMYMGLPIIATDCRGNRDLIKDGINGCLIHINDYRTLIEKIIELSENKEMCEIYSKNNKNDVRKYLFGDIITKVEKIYLDLLGEVH